MTIGTFVRYTDEAHAYLIEAWPELGPVLIRPTYKEASDAAIVAVIGTLAETRPSDPIRVIHHPHQPESEDPLGAFGSWGWKTEASQSALLGDG